jgi:hypothetical protein
MPVAIIGIAACVVASDIYVFGDDGSCADASVFNFDTEDNTWSELAPMPYACTPSSASVLDSLIYVVGP